MKTMKKSNTLIFLALFAITALFMNSCTIEKRVYNKGYHTLSVKKTNSKTPAFIEKEDAADKQASLNETVNYQDKKSVFVNKDHSMSDIVVLKNNKEIAGKLGLSNARKTIINQNGVNKIVKNKDISFVKQANNEVFVPQNNAKTKKLEMKKAIDKESFLPNLLSIIFGGAAFLIFLWIAVALYFNPVVSLIFALLTIGLGIAAIIFGIKGLRAGGQFKWMGIVGIATGAAACLIALIILILDIVHIARGWTSGVVVY